MMRVLFLGPETSPVFQWLRSQKNIVIIQTDKILKTTELFDAIVSHGYRHMVTKYILDRHKGRAINLHASLLPWNRGADPNFWSFAADTPKGVTIHYMNEGLDKGDIIAQRRVLFTGAGHTLKSTYNCLQACMLKLFKEVWIPFILDNITGTPQEGAGSYHRSRDKQLYEHLLTEGWNTPVSKIRGCACETQDSQNF